VAALPSNVVLETVVDADKRIRIVGGIDGELIHLGNQCCMPGTRSTGSSTRRSPSLTRIDVYKYVAYDGLTTASGCTLDGFMRSYPVPASSPTSRPAAC
jgi:hypothetical protein